MFYKYLLKSDSERANPLENTRSTKNITFLKSTSKWGLQPALPSYEKPLFSLTF